MEALDVNLQSAVQGLRDNLMNQIQEINMQRGQLESQKATAKLDLLTQFKQAKAETEARNAAFRQQLFLTAQQGKQQAQALRDSATNDYATVIKSFES